MSDQIRCSNSEKLFSQCNRKTLFCSISIPYIELSPLKVTKSESVIRYVFFSQYEHEKMFSRSMSTKKCYDVEKMSRKDGEKRIQRIGSLVDQCGRTCLQSETTFAMKYSQCNVCSATFAVKYFYIASYWQVLAVFQIKD